MNFILFKGFDITALFFKSLGLLYQINAFGIICAWRFENQFIRNTYLKSLRVFISWISLAKFAWPSYKEHKSKLKDPLGIYSFSFRQFVLLETPALRQKIWEGWSQLFDLSLPEIKLPMKYIKRSTLSQGVVIVKWHNVFHEFQNAVKVKAIPYTNIYWNLLWGDLGGKYRHNLWFHPICRLL